MLKIQLYRHRFKLPSSLCHPCNHLCNRYQLQYIRYIRVCLDNLSNRWHLCNLRIICKRSLHRMVSPHSQAKLRNQVHQCSQVKEYSQLNLFNQVNLCKEICLFIQVNLCKQGILFHQCNQWFRVNLCIPFNKVKLVNQWHQDNLCIQYIQDTQCSQVNQRNLFNILRQCHRVNNLPDQHQISNLQS